VTVEGSDSDAEVDAAAKFSKVPYPAKLPHHLVTQSHPLKPMKEEHLANEKMNQKKKTQNGRIPPQLQDLHDSRADEKFQEYYMTYITREHADDLETLRSAPDFTDRSLPLLIRALRSGVDIFNKEEKATIVGLAQEGETH